MLDDLRHEAELTPVQRLLIEAKLELITKSGNPRISDNKFAKWLGISSGALNQWFNANRIPNYKSTWILAKRLGLKAFDACGYDRPKLWNDKRLDLIVYNWDDVPPEDQKQIYEHVKEVITGGNGSGRKQQSKDGG